jgi:hypothetical protein
MSTSLHLIRMCRICGNAAALEKSKTDEHGNAVHGLCYAAKIALADKSPLVETYSELCRELAESRV